VSKPFEGTYGSMFTAMVGACGPPKFLSRCCWARPLVCEPSLHRPIYSTFWFDLLLSPLSRAPSVLGFLAGRRRPAPLVIPPTTLPTSGHAHPKKQHSGWTPPSLHPPKARRMMGPSPWRAGRRWGGHVAGLCFGYVHVQWATFSSPSRHPHVYGLVSLPHR
jgi:hypothetical protein